MESHSTAPLFSVASALDRYILDTETPRPFDNKWHPSAISLCQRKAIYEIRQTPPDYPTTPAQRRIFRIGHVWHAFFQKAVAAFPGLAAVYTEVKVLGGELDIAGAGDQVVVDAADDAELVEFKTTKEWGFKSLKGPKPDHLKQTKNYGTLLRLFGGRWCPFSNEGEHVECRGCEVVPPLPNLKRVRFVYINKQDLDIKEFVVDWDPAWEQEVREDIATLDEYRADPISLPPRLPLEKGKKNWLCAGYCEFRDRCWQKDPAVVPADPDVF